MEDMEVGKKHEQSRILKFSLTYFQEELTAAFILRLTFASLKIFSQTLPHQAEVSTAGNPDVVEQREEGSSWINQSSRKQLCWSNLKGLIVWHTGQEVKKLIVRV